MSALDYVFVALVMVAMGLLLAKVAHERQLFMLSQDASYTTR